MSRFGELMALFLQESEETERNRTTIVDLLTDRAMDGGDRVRRRKSLHQRLGLKSMVCCGSTWGLGTGSSALSTHTDDDNDNDNDNNDILEIESTHQQTEVIDVIVTQPDVGFNPGCILQSPRMNLADALAAERHFRSINETGNADVQLPNQEREVATPPRMSLMRLLEETEIETDGQDEGTGRDQVCCVCMERKKGAAFIPCGHTYCRVCCREIWLNRGVVNLEELKDTKFEVA
ncbi:hypothetical protein E3N88_18971 [Mikania micrantha]|uniref:Uncharacterized protein n=1 Tax=Mikania micrantha TaxID=192012 RepID=A0A5N6NP99_9ASTR|nr:hypothetical protein E3N88_18971 [Mikania micrantha]